MNLQINVEKKIKRRQFFYLSAIVLGAIILRLVYFPYNIPVSVDSLEYFLYAADIVALGHLPDTWMAINNGWPIFLSFWFSLIPLNEVIEFMTLQRILAVIFSSITAIPIYFLCKKFVEPEYAAFASMLFVFDPRILTNSILGITEALYIFLGITSLVLLLKNDRKTVMFSLIIASLCVIVRGEGIFFVFAIIIIFFIRNKINKKSIGIFLPSISLFFLILIPVLLHRIDVTGSDGVFLRATVSAVQTSVQSQQNNFENIFGGVEIFFKYLGWVMIPNFIVFVPIGIIHFFKNQTAENKFIIIFLVLMSIPAFYAYTVPAQDTRYLYFMFPIFCLLSAFALRKYVSKKRSKNLLVIIIIIGVVSSSIIFYEFKKDDWRVDNHKEIEYLEISKEINQIVKSTNYHPVLGRYMHAIQVMDNWPIFHDQISSTTNLISVKEKSLEEFIEKNEKQLTHIIIDNESNLPEFLNEIYHNEKNYIYLELVYDSKNQGYNQEFKVFKINYEIINSKK